MLQYYCVGAHLAKSVEIVYIHPVLHLRDISMFSINLFDADFNG